MLRTLFASLILMLTPMMALAAVEIGKPAPAFSAKDIAGKEQSIAAHKGKIIVLEWHNPGCPFVVKHYDSKNMQALQADAAKKGVVWLSVNSGAAGRQGHMSADEASAYLQAKDASPAAYIIDAEGTIGRAYGASTTPHMFVIDAKGNVAYAGAIDDNNSANPKDALTARNYVSAAIDALLAGKSPEVSATQPYGCGVKY